MTAFMYSIYYSCIVCEFVFAEWMCEWIFGLHIDIWAYTYHNLCKEISINYAERKAYTFRIGSFLFLILISKIDCKLVTILINKDHMHTYSDSRIKTILAHLRIIYCVALV